MAAPPTHTSDSGKEAGRAYGRYLWLAVLVFLCVVSADRVLRPIPEFDELASVTAAVTEHEIYRTKLRFELEGVDHEFEASINLTDQFYAIVKAAEERQQLTLWTWPAVLEGHAWPLVPFHTKQPWQLESEGAVLISYEQIAEKSRGDVLGFWVIFLCSAFALIWLFFRALRSGEDPRRATRRAARRDEPADDDGEQEDDSLAMPRAARWFWDIFGGGVLVMAVLIYFESQGDQGGAIPAATDLIEVSGEVTDLEVETRTVGSGAHSSGHEVISGISFTVAHGEPRLLIMKGHWRYDLLARRLIPGVFARILIRRPEWLAEHGKSTRNEDVWSVEVDGEQILSLEEEVAVARRWRERPFPWLFLVLVTLGGAAFFAHGRLWGRGRKGRRR